MIQVLTTKPALTIVAGVLCLWAGLASAEVIQVTGLTAGDSLSVRTGPNAASADIGDLQEGETVDVLGKNFAGTWSQIQYQGQMAWVASSYLVQPVSGDANVVSSGPNVVTGIPADDPDGGLVVREGAGTSYRSLAVIPNGAAVHIIQKSPDQEWGMIALADGVGWVSTHYLAAITSTPNPMPLADPQTAPDGGSPPAVSR